MNRGFLHSVAILFLLLLTASCSNFQKLLKSNDVDQKYQAALQYYEKEDYYRANQLLEQVLPLLSGRQEAEQAKFYFANTYFEQGDYLLSAFHFKSFYELYPRSPLAEEAMFLYAKSNYNSSPSYEQDQNSTEAALEALQEFLVRYPESKFAGEANQMVEDLNIKLDRKAFVNAELYYKLRYYQSAVVALGNFIREHPSSPYSAEASYLRLESQFKYAQESVTTKQKERYLEVVDFYQGFVDQYPDSKYKRSAEQIYDQALEALDKLKSKEDVNS